jgi:hypothetical protein
VAAYKERKVFPGIYALRCTATRQIWVGSALDLSTIQNRLRFALSQGNHPRPTVQEASRAHGPAGFTYEELERLEPDESDYIRDAILKERTAHWRIQLKAGAI